MSLFNRKKCALLLYCGGVLVRSYKFTSVVDCKGFISRNKEL